MVDVVNGLLTLDGVLLAGAGVAAVGLVWSTLAQRAAPSIGWLTVPGALVAAALVAFACRDSDRPLEDLPMLLAAIGLVTPYCWSVTAALVAVALVVRPDAEALPSPGRAGLELAAVALAALAAVLFAGAADPRDWLLAVVPLASIVAQVRTSPRFREARGNAALLQLAATLGSLGFLVSCAVGDTLGVDTWRDPPTEAVLAMGLTQLALAIAGAVNGQVQSWHRGALVLSIAVSASAATVGAVVVVDQLPAIRVGETHAELARTERTHGAIPVDACITGPDRVSCGPGADVVWVGPADVPLPAHIVDPDQGPHELSVALRGPEGLTAIGIHVLGETCGHARTGTWCTFAPDPGRDDQVVGLHVARGGAGISVNSAPDAHSGTVAEALRVRTSKCAPGRHLPMVFAVEDAWTPRELATLCPGLECWLVPRSEIQPTEECIPPW